jgi:hypothetical protein
MEELIQYTTVVHVSRYVQLNIQSALRLKQTDSITKDLRQEHKQNSRWKK